MVTSFMQEKSLCKTYINPCLYINTTENPVTKILHVSTDVDGLTGWDNKAAMGVFMFRNESIFYVVK